jgi:DNA-binding response OmpR family regulator
MRILVVIEEQSMRQILKKSLEAECYAVDITTNSAKGMQMVDNNHYSALIIDDGVPEMSGLEFTEKIRQFGSSTPILILSANSDVSVKAEILNAGADDYLAKPYSVVELLARLKALLRRPNQLTIEVYRVHDLMLDVKRHIVKRGENNIYLTRKEFSFLKYLLQNRGIVLSRSMIIENVWGVGADPFSNTIESHIMSLRKKIDTPDKEKLIHTITGRGYKIE